MGSDNRGKDTGSPLRAIVLCLTFVCVFSVVGWILDPKRSVTQPTSLSLRRLDGDTVRRDLRPLRSEESSSAELPKANPLNAASLETAVARVQPLDERVRAMKKAGVVMEEDHDALALIAELQAATRELLLLEYGPGSSEGTYRLEIAVRFPDKMPDGRDAYGSFVVETAPRDLMPHAVHTFMRVVKRWEENGGGSFHRNAGHVLQVNVRQRLSPTPGLAFQEYSNHYPHVDRTLGFAGRPGGPPFYISIVDNTRNHGPGSQGSQTEADSCFAKVVDGFDIVDRLAKVWGHRSKGFDLDRMGFIADGTQHVEIESIRMQT